jgi:uncharacterized protein YjbK
MPVEREVKLRIRDRAGFERLLAAVAPLRTLHQVNRYFDTPSRSLAAEGAAVRVREEEGRVVLTVKSGARRGPGRVEVEEWECDLDPVAWRAIELGEAPLATVAFEPLERVRAGRPLVLVGRLENTRLEARAPDGTLFQLDETRFPWGETDYELEIESDDVAGALAAAKELLAKLGVAFDEHVRTKQERLLGGPPA